MSHRSGDRARSDKQRTKKRVIRAHRAALKQSAVEGRVKMEAAPVSASEPVTSNVVSSDKVEVQEDAVK